MKILAIETSCDETAIALVNCNGTLRQAQGQKLRFEVLENLISSQVEIHRPFGGVVPVLAKREHIKNLPVLTKQIFKNPELKIDLIAVTVGPGLEPALWTGIEFAKELSKNLKKPLIGANHMEGHLYSSLLGTGKKNEIKFPAIALVVSGGHTILLKMDSLVKWKKLGETRDDAAGEAFDKVARLLGLPYPGGPEISKLAENGNAEAINFPRPMSKILSGAKGKHYNYDFSFSGLKTAVFYFLRDTAKFNKADVAASVQEAIVDVLIKKTMRAVQEFGAKSVILCGGVAANKALRERLKSKMLNLQFLCPDFEFNTDNAAMIAAAAYMRKISKKKGYKLVADSNLTL